MAKASVTLRKTASATAPRRRAGTFTVRKAMSTIDPRRCYAETPVRAALSSGAVIAEVSNQSGRICSTLS
jgi:hypothetical protein